MNSQNPINTLLIVNGDSRERRFLKDSLETESFIVFEASIARRLIEIVQNHHVDLILLNYGLPDGEAIDFLKSIREYTDAPLIITSHRMETCQKITSLNMGADDFIMKPYNVEELIARIKARLRRYSHLPQDNEKPLDAACLARQVKFANFIFDRARLQVFTESGKSLNLTHAEFRLLEILINGHTGVLMREEICQKLSQSCHHQIHENALNIKVMRLRRKLGDSLRPPSIIRTVRDVGYIMDIPLQIIS